MLCVIGMRRKCRTTPGTPGHATGNLGAGPTLMIRFSTPYTYVLIGLKEGTRQPTLPRP